jgi:hypothetical protein
MVVPIPLIAALVLGLLNYLGFWGGKMPGNPSKYSAMGLTGSAVLLLSLGVMLSLSWLLLSVARRAALQQPDDSARARIRGALSSGTVMLLVLFGLAGVLFLVPSLFELYNLFENQVGPWWHLSDKTISTILALVPFLSGIAMSVLKTGRLQKFFSWLLVLSGPLLYIWVILFVGAKLGLAGQSHWEWNWLAVSVATAVLVFWSVFLVDINSGGPHGYYRDRLCECYLGRRGDNELTWWQTAVQRLWSSRKHPHQPSTVQQGSIVQSALVEKTGPVGNRLRLPLTDLAKPGLTPYHLVNTIVNLPASANQELRGRDGDFFLISPFVCGSPICGYFPTDKLTAKDQHIDLGTAMAISAAAAAPNMGFHTLPQFRFLMALFNVRLGY